MSVENAANEKLFDRFTTLFNGPYENKFEEIKSGCKSTPFFEDQ